MSNSNSKPTILILFGGPSDEHEVSISSARAISKNIDLEKFTVNYLYITKNSKAKIFAEFSDSIFSENISKDFSENLLDIKSYDLAFIGCLHGNFGEDGQIQRLFEENKIKYSGSNSSSSSICMDKSKTLEIISKLQIQTSNLTLKIAKSKLCSNYLESKEFITNNKLGFPIVLKPNSSGSSVGVKICKNISEVESYFDNSTLGKKVLVEEFILGTEFTCGVLETKDYKYFKLPPVEIRPKLGSFFDYDSKYKVGGSEEICPPSSISKDIADEISEISKQIHQILKCKLYSRSDFILQNDALYYLETNTLPGLTETSLLPKETKAIGMSYKELITFLIENSL